MKQKVKCLFLCCAVFSCVSVKMLGQKVQVETTNLEITDNKLVIDYQFVKSKKSQRFNVWVEISTVTGRKLNASSLSGDIGDSIQGRYPKQIIWDYNADGIILKEEVKVIIYANIFDLGPSFGKSVLLSSLVPGLGLTKMKDGGPYWLMGVAAYGALGTSLYLNHETVNNYNAYLESQDKSKSNELFNTSRNYKQMSDIMAYSAIGIWSTSIIWTIIKARKKNTSMANLYRNKKMFFYTAIDPTSKTAGFNLKFRF